MYAIGARTIIRKPRFRVPPKLGVPDSLNCTASRVPMSPLISILIKIRCCAAKQWKMTGKKNKKKAKRSKAPIPLAPPQVMKSRRLARITTTLFHKHTRERDLALKKGDREAAERAEDAIEAIGGREAYQKASQLNTSHHSTSKWAMGVLGEKGLLMGVPLPRADDDRQETNDGRKGKGKKGRKSPRRNLKLLEVGAINRELLDAASKTRPRKSGNKDVCVSEEVPVYRLDVRSIDLRSSQPGIEEADFLQLPILRDSSSRYDAIVCSMVINCVTTPEDRGRMLASLFHHLRPGGLCFLTLPRLCLTQSARTSPEHFRLMLTEGVGFEVERCRESPKVQFYVLERPVADLDVQRNRVLDSRFTKITIINRGKKYRNEFCCVLDEKQVNGVF